MSNVDPCAICLEQLTSTPLGKKRSISRPTTYSMRCCSHEFHKSCIKSWFTQELAEGKLGRSCPMCRAVEAPKPKAIKKQRARANTHTHIHTPGPAAPRMPVRGARARAATAGSALIMPAPERVQKRGFFAWLFRRGARSRDSNSSSSNAAPQRRMQRQSSSFTNLAELGHQALPPQPATTSSSSNSSSSSSPPQSPPRPQRAMASNNMHIPAGHHEHYRAAVWPVSAVLQNQPLLGEGTRSERYQIRLLAPGEPLPPGARLATASAAPGTIGMVLILQGPAASTAGGSGSGGVGSRPRVAMAPSAARTTMTAT